VKKMYEKLQGIQHFCVSFSLEKWFNRSKKMYHLQFIPSMYLKHIETLKDIFYTVVYIYRCPFSQWVCTLRPRYHPAHSGLSAKVLGKKLTRCDGDCCLFKCIPSHTNTHAHLGGSWYPSAPLDPFGHPFGPPFAPLTTHLPPLLPWII